MSTMYVNNIAPLEGTTINVASGNTLAAPGSTVQIANSTYETETSTTSTSYSDTGLTVTITPKFSTSKILILLSLGSSGINNTGAETRGYWRLMRDSTELYNMDLRSYDYGGSGTVHFAAHGQSFVDTPNTTSAIIYKLQQKASTGTIRVCEADRLISIQALEIAQ